MIGKPPDPRTKQLIAYSTCCEFGGAERIVWVNGRPHPPAYAERTFQGFSTGRWNGNSFTVTTTHLRTGFLNRNGTPASSKSTVIEYFIRQGDELTIVQFVDDPAYLEMPMIRTHDFVRNPAPGGAPAVSERFEDHRRSGQLSKGVRPELRPRNEAHENGSCFQGISRDQTMMMGPDRAGLVECPHQPALDARRRGEAFPSRATVRSACSNSCSSVFVHSLFI